VDAVYRSAAAGREVALRASEQGPAGSAPAEGGSEAP
jgi:hypothetical protein